MRPADSLTVRIMSKMVKKRRRSLSWSRLAHSLLLHQAVWSPTWLPSLRTAYPCEEWHEHFQPKHNGPERTLFCRSFSASAVISVMEACWEPAISIHSHHVSLVQWTNPLLPITRDLGSNPLGDLCETGILLLVPSRYKPLHWGFSDLPLPVSPPCLLIIAYFSFLHSCQGPCHGRPSWKFPLKRFYEIAMGIMMAKLQGVRRERWMADQLQPIRYQIGKRGWNKAFANGDR